MSGRRGVIRRLLPAAAAFALVLGVVVFFYPQLREVLGTEAGSPRSGAATHPLYSASPVPSHCELPKDRDADVRRTLGELSRCLDRMWTATLRAAGYEYEPPGEVNLVETAAESSCGRDDDGWAGIYCPETRSVNVLLDASWAFSDMFTLAHEYAHHVQEISGIADQNGSEIFDEAWSRRLELQADCMAAAAMREIDSEAVAMVRAAAGHPGADAEEAWAAHRKTHGSARNSAAWIKRGERQGTIGACNTWAAPQDQVS
ncbi:neutral zinc metallopeptidase [Spongiactinospora sp. TRM90649]|uniref:neutral zinc metallopeptidase n=1 Tax=Spongiactinospora sp. TRM90649 TaxID=3031114 RepID=UPI0023F9F08A|nr:neutral zinc metallopeptidase [Spongiactinospora sp. TRM90649]MDF5752525.1 neutral zinc metallopeptidase [Spongiactinospora sp. TRM90649]